MNKKELNASWLDKKNWIGVSDWSSPTVTVNNVYCGFKFLKVICYDRIK